MQISSGFVAAVLPSLLGLTLAGCGDGSSTASNTSPGTTESSAHASPMPLHTAVRSAAVGSPPASAAPVSGPAASGAAASKPTGAAAANAPLASKPPVAAPPVIAPPEPAPPVTAQHAASSAMPVNLTWTAPTNTISGSELQLGSYRIYYGSSADSLSNVVTLAASETSYTFQNLAAGSWYFAVTAVSTGNVESALSAIVPTET